MHRNKLPFILFVFLFALLFILGIIGEGRQWPGASLLFWGGQAGFGLSIIVYFLVPSKEEDES